MCENQLQYFEEIEFFDRLWGMEQIESPLLVTPKADPSPTVSPWLDEPDFWICQEHFSESEEKCLDHCHPSGKFLGWTHDKCNLTRRNINYSPVVGHNLQNYNMHHICLALNECDSRSIVQYKSFHPPTRNIFH